MKNSQNSHMDQLDQIDFKGLKVIEDFKYQLAKKNQEIEGSNIQV